MAPKVQARRQPPRRNNVRIETRETGSAREAVMSKENESIDDSMQNHGAEDVEMASEDIMDTELDRATEQSGPVSLDNMGTPERPVQSQRLDSLHRGSVTTARRPGGLKFQPKSSFIRRSKEEREAQARAEEEKSRARQAAGRAPVSTPANPPGLLQGRGAYGRGGAFAGGMSGWRYDKRGNGNFARSSHSQASGPLSGAPTFGDNSASKRRSARGVGRATSGPNTSEPVGAGKASSVVKQEPPPKAEKGKAKASVPTKRGATERKEPKIKKEDPIVLRQSSDEELDPEEGPRINIEHINLLSDDDTEGESVTNPNSPNGQSQRIPGSSFRPVRIDRHEHVERTAVVNSEPAPVTSAELRRRAKARGDAEGSLFLPETDDGLESATLFPKKKSKTKDIEFVRNERVWKGVYQEEDKKLQEEPKIKKEPEEDGVDDPMVIDAEHTEGQAGPSIHEGSLSKQPATGTARKPHPLQEDQDSDQSGTSKPKRHRKPDFRDLRPSNFQTQEDIDEWQRHKKDVQVLSEELGAMQPITVPEDQLDEDTPMAEEGDAEIKRDRKAGLVYLFQLPPLIPNLVDPNDKSSPEITQTSSQPVPTPTASTSTSTSYPTNQPSTSDTTTTTTTNPRVKFEPPDHPPTTHHLPEPLTASSTSTLATGQVGTLSMHESGAAILDWGGLSFEISRANEVELLQSVVCADVVHEGRGVKREDEERDRERERMDLAHEGGGDARLMTEALGTVMGGFVASPNWRAIFDT
ncbi:hypothetical protein MMC09_004992 [Bachmanniomyces sp. S44760]|nr:hypothetical protein [Bachmanniomyces sp. S44760]